jgi:hypothetical protein
MINTAQAKWPEVRIGDILSYLNERIDLEDSSEYVTITVKRRHGGLEEREHLLGHQIKSRKQFRVIPSAFIISRVQCWHEAYAIVPTDVPRNMIASANYDQFAISPGVDSRFFWWLSHSPHFRETVRSSAFGVVIEKMVFNRDAWLNKMVPLPPLSEQKRLVKRIEELAGKVEGLCKLGRESTVESDALSASYSKMVFAQGYADWPQVQLNDVCSLITDGTHQTPRYVDEGMPFLSAQNIKPYRFMPENHRNVSVEDFLAYTRRAKPEKGDILMTRVGAMIGEAAMIDRNLEFAIYVSLCLIKPLPERVYSPYLVHWLNSPFGATAAREKTLGKGHSQGNLNLKLIREFKLPLPSIPEQKRITALIDAMHQKIEQARKLRSAISKETEALIPSILDQAYRGDL